MAEFIIAVSVDSAEFIIAGVVVVVAGRARSVSLMQEVRAEGGGEDEKGASAAAISAAGMAWSQSQSQFLFVGSLPGIVPAFDPGRCQSGSFICSVTARHLHTGHYIPFVRANNDDG